ncbi:unnamed protein product [Pedinophyceae sp. YPF-701]|nr:unnamed protein product [Pedinophyceae sp. YPF-701]
MAFTFGAASSAPAFGAAGGTSTPFGSTGAAFGASGGQAGAAFGAQSKPAFGAAASSSPLFGGGASTGLSFGGGFGQAGGASNPQQGGSLFGGSGTPQATQTGSLFGGQTPAAASGGAFSFGGLGQASAGAGGAFGQGPGGSTGLFGGSPAPQTPAFGQVGTPVVQQNVAPLQAKADNNRTGPTKWSDLTEPSQAWLLELESKIVKASGDLKDLEAQQASVSGSPDSPDVMERRLRLARQEVAAVAREMRNGEGLVRLVREHVLLTNAHATDAWRRAEYLCRPVEHRLQLAQGYYDLHGARPLPSPMLSETLTQFERRAVQLEGRISHLETALSASQGAGSGGGAAAGSAVRSLPRVVSQLMELVVRLAARVEGTHAQVERMRAQFLEHRKLMGDPSDPFAAADRRERAQSATLRGTPSVGRIGGGGDAAASPGALGTPGTTPMLQSGAGGAAAPASGGGFLFGAGTPAGAQKPAFGASTSQPASTGFGAGGGGLFGGAGGTTSAAFQTPAPTRSASLSITPPPAGSNPGDNTPELGSGKKRHM